MGLQKKSASNAQSSIVLLDTSFSTQSVTYERRVADLFVTEFLVNLILRLNVCFKCSHRLLHVVNLSTPTLKS
jgi:hypothetical protein